jgi:hypothetical protein
VADVRPPRLRFDGVFGTSSSRSKSESAGFYGGSDSVSEATDGCAEDPEGEEILKALARIPRPRERPSCVVSSQEACPSWARYARVSASSKDSAAKSHFLPFRLGIRLPFFGDPGLWFGGLRYGVADTHCPSRPVTRWRSLSMFPVRFPGEFVEETA